MRAFSYEELFIEVCADCRMLLRPDDTREGIEFHRRNCVALRRDTRKAVYTSTAAAAVDGGLRMPPAWDHIIQGEA